MFEDRYGTAVGKHPLAACFCSSDLNERRSVIVADTVLDRRFPDDLPSIGDNPIRFYAAIPLITPDEEVLGALCLVDTVPRELTALQVETLEVTSRQIMAQLELHRQSGQIAAEEARLRVALEAAQMSPFEWDLREDMIVRFPSGDEIMGFAPGENDGSFGMFLQQVHPEDRAALRAALESAMMNRIPVVHEFRIHNQEGEIRWISGHGEYSYDESGVPILMFGVILDVTERKESELHIKRLNRVYSVLGEVNQTITRERVPSRLLEASCKIAVENGGYPLAWIGLRESVDADLQVAAYAGGSPASREETERFLVRECTSGCWCDADTSPTERHTVCTITDKEKDPRAEHSTSLDREFRTKVLLPLLIDGEVLGVFTIYSRETDFFDEEELQLLDELAIDISFALEIRKHETEKIEVNQALRTSEERLSAALKIARLSHWHYDLKTDVFHFNDHFYRLLRTTAEREGGYQMSPDQYADRFLPSDESHLVRTEAEKAIKSPDKDYSTQLEHRVNFGDGTTGYLTVRVFKDLDEAGRTIGIHGVNQDITERKLSENAVKEAERRFRALIEHSSDCIFPGRQGWQDSLHQFLHQISGRVRQSGTSRKARLHQRPSRRPAPTPGNTKTTARKA